MPASSSRTVARIAWGLLRAGIYAALAGVVLFFALTRTEVGRDRLRLEIQEAFNARFEGSLQIGTLSGTLLNDLQATDVRLRDETGRLVATVDSVAGQPAWGALVTGELSVESLLLIRPHLSLHRRADGTWNVRHALRPRAPTASSGQLPLSVLDLEVRAGQITTSRDGAPPSVVADRWLFDYTRSGLDRLYATASIKWTDATRRLRVQDLRFRLPEQDLALQSARVEVGRDRDRWAIDPVSVQIGNTDLRARGTVQPSPRDPGTLALDLSLAESRLDHDELRRLVPRLPVRETVTMEGRLGGTLDRFVVNHLTLRHRRSRVTVEGTAFGLPDSLSVDAQILQSRVRPSDVRSVWPGAPLDRVRRIGPVRLNAGLRGEVTWASLPRPAFDLTGTLFAQGTPGTVRGSLDVARDGNGPLRYTGQVRIDSLNLAPITNMDRLDSRLTGRTEIQGSGTRFSTLRGTLDADLSASRVGARRVSGATLALKATPNAVTGTLALQQPAGGRLTLDGGLNATGPAPQYELSATSEAFNLAAAHPSLPQTALNATLTADGQGASWTALTGTMSVSVDSSHLERPQAAQSLPPHTVTLMLADPASDAPRLQVGGTLATATVEGTPLAPTLRSSARRWQAALRQAARRTGLPAADSAGLAPLSLPPDTPSTRAAPLQLQADLAVHRMDLLRQWWPGAPNNSDSLRTSARLLLGPDTLSLSGSLSAGRLQVGSRRAAGLTAAYALSGPLRPNLAHTLSASVSARADTLHLGSRALVAPSTTVTLGDGTGTLAAEVHQVGRTGPFRLASTLHLNDGLAFRITDLYAGAGENTWTTERPGTVTVHSDAVVVDSLALTSPRPRTQTAQQLLLRGTLSARATDTLHAEMSDVLLYPIGELASLPRPLGGRLNGEVALTGGWARPQVRSAFTVDRLTFDRRVLGDLRVQSRLMPNAPDLLVDAALTPAPSSINALNGPPLVPNGPRVIEENRLQMRGRVRLPGWAESASAAPNTPPLDLVVDVDRADLFFFKYIFEETLAKVRGYTAGRIHIGGRFRKPIFDAELDIREGRFTLPKFGLAYTARGPVAVDRQGIHLQELAVTDDDGSAVVNGSILFNDYRFFSFDLSAQLDELTIINVDDARDLAFYGDIRASGNASLTGPLQDATLRSDGARTTPDSELFIPVSESDVSEGTGFIVFADSTGQIPDLRDLTRRDNILSDRPAGEPTFLEGLEIDINVLAPDESTVHLVFDPVVGDVVTAVGSGRVQLQRQEGEFFVYGRYNVTGGTYLFTAGEVFVRRFNINEGTITWDGPPTNAQLALKADYRTRASPAGLPGYDDNAGRIPVRVNLDIGGRVETPRVDLSLARVRDERTNLVGSRTLDAILNQPDRTTEYATSVLLTNTFLLTTETFTQGQTTSPDGSSSGSLTTAGNQLAFNSVSQLVASQLNRYLGAALPNVDFNFGVQGENPNDLDLIYGVALRLLNERLVIRGEGVYTGDDPGSQQAQGPQGEFVVEVRLSRRVSVEAFYRRSGDELTQGQTLTSSTGAGLSYQTEFPTWRRLFRRVFGWLLPDSSPDAPPPPETPPDDDAPPPDSTADPVARRDTSRAPASTGPNR